LFICLFLMIKVDCQRVIFDPPSNITCGEDLILNVTCCLFC
jgi:hypothetical protein